MTAHALGRVTLMTIVASGLVLAGCTGGSPDRQSVDTVSLGELRLVGFDSCEQALADLREALSSRVGPYGLGGGSGTGSGTDLAVPAAPGQPGPPPPAPQREPGRSGPLAPGQAEADAGKAEAAAPNQPAGRDAEHSTTNVHEAGVDEPDLVKTDGRRIVSMIDGTLRVVDAASKAVTGSLRLSDQPMMPGEANLLLSGDRALIIPSQVFGIAEDRVAPGLPPTPDQGPPPWLDQPTQQGQPADPPQPIAGPELILVDLAETPKELARFTIDGRYIDARMVGNTVRVVTASSPRLNFITPSGPDDERNAMNANREIVAKAGIESWLPRYRSSTPHGVSEGRVDCSALTHPARYSATSMLTVLSFDLTTPNLGTGDPVSIVADGETVYGTQSSLYVANAAFPPVANRRPEQPPGTELYKFDITGSGKPRHVGSGAVPGRLLNQYSMSEYQGKLRVATTVGPPGGPRSESSVYVLEPRGDKLPVIGQVGGLGKNEQIYAVRFIGPVGYVVTFRRTDPLYTLDLRDPAAPRVAGELKINGYSAYLHPAGDNRLIGVGQDATDQGRVTGTQVSLFDVSDPSRPARIAQYQVPGGHSEAEYDPHAFLYWAKTSTLVLPTMTRYDRIGALVLRVGDAALVEVGNVQHPTASGPIRRSLVIGDELWTMSISGLAANDLSALADRGWVAFG
jgi:hypothetical protein